MRYDARHEGGAGVRSLVVRTVACVAALVPFSAHADYTKAAEERFLSHAAHDFTFSTVPILARQKATTRDDAVRAVRDVLQRVIATSASAPTAPDALAQALYNSDLVVAERGRLESALMRAPEDTKRLIADVDGLRIIESEDTTAINREGVFDVTVRNDGHAFELYNRLADYHRTDNLEAKLPDDAAADLARAFITEAGLVPATDLDQLFLVKTRFTHFTGNTMDPGDRVVSTSVYFGRQIDGVPVVSAKGSHITVEFAAEQAIRRVVVDWSPLVATGDTQTVADAGVFYDRTSGAVAAILLDNAQTSGDFEVTRVNCGYVDFGAKYRTTIFLQLGCEVTVRPLGTNQPSILHVPLADDVVPQPGWTSQEIVEAHEALARDTSVSVGLYGLPASNMTPSTPQGAAP